MCAEVAEWQTHLTQNQAPSGCVGSTPTFGTKKELNAGLDSPAFFILVKNKRCSIAFGNFTAIGLWLTSDAAESSKKQNLYQAIRSNSSANIA